MTHSPVTDSAEPLKLPRLGDLLASKGLVTQAQVTLALEVQQRFGGRLGTNLVELGILTEEQITRCLSEHIGMPFCGADAVANLAPETIARVPAKVALRFRCVPLAMDGTTVTIGLADHAVLAELSELSAAVGAEVSLALITELTLSYALDRYYAIRREVRGLQLAGVVDAYRWLSDASGRLSTCGTFEEIVALLSRVLAERFGASTRVLWVEGDALVSHHEKESQLFEPSILPIDALRTQTGPLLLDQTLLCPVRDHHALRACISMHGITPEFGDIELIQVLLESTAHAIGLLEEQAKVVKGEQLAQSLGRYVTGRVVDELKLDHEMVLFGRKQEVSIMFVDIRGFTTISEHLDPDRTVLMLNIFFAEMSSAIAQFAGTLDKFIGDGLMAFWGAPTSVSNHASLAVRAATEMQARMPRVNRKLQRLQIENVEPLSIGIGICTGLVLVGNIGTPQLMQYTAVGDVVNVAARLCSTAEKGEILVNDKTAALVPDLRCEPRGPLLVKGRSEPVFVHRICASS